MVDTSTLSTPTRIEITSFVPIPRSKIVPMATILLDTPTFEPSFTPTISPTRKPTLLPTLSHEESQKRITLLMETNANCIGDCFWGIDPEKTSFDQAVQLLQIIQEKKIPKAKDVYTNSYQIDENNIGVSVSISGADEKIRNLKATVVGLESRDVTGKDWLAFQPDNFLEEHGSPKQIYVAMSEGPEGRISYGIAFQYNNMLIMYNGSQTITKPQMILHACPTMDNNIDRFDLVIGQDDKTLLEGWVDVTNMSSLTNDDFFENFVQNGEKACFDLDYTRFLSPKY